ncbi:MAG: hypothetical protein GW865_04415, partial [Candidatus Aenigmarchaeota archaeon]|nr:hypothetical protein [Candidatus Aenigmarchaeota archaeon]
LSEKIKGVDVGWKPEAKVVEVIKEVIVEKPKIEEPQHEKDDKPWRRRNLEVA